MRRITLGALLLGACTPSVSTDSTIVLLADQRCGLSVEDRRWLTEATAGWRVAARNFLKAPPRQLPTIVFYDAECSYTYATGASTTPGWTSAEHRGGIITLPNGGRATVVPSASNVETGPGTSFVLMSLPSIWRPIAPKSVIPLEWFLEGVLLHELSHAYQVAATPQVSFRALLELSTAPLRKVSDDGVQEAFASNADYVRLFEAERDILFEAASAPTNMEARALACDGLALLRARRARYFSGPANLWLPVDELSLTSEGLGQWVSYKWMTSRRGLPASLALSKLRGHYWSQDEGLAIFLVVDRLVPNWQRRLFGHDPETAEQLLARACARANGS